MKVISIRLNDEEEKLLDDQIKKSGISKSKFMKSRILSDTLTEQQAYMKKSKIQKSYANILMEIQKKGIGLNEEILDEFSEAVSGYVYY